MQKIPIDEIIRNQRFTKVVYTGPFSIDCSTVPDTINISTSDNVAAAKIKWWRIVIVLSGINKRVRITARFCCRPHIPTNYRRRIRIRAVCNAAYGRRELNISSNKYTTHLMNTNIGVSLPDTCCKVLVTIGSLTKCYNIISCIQNLLQRILVKSSIILLKVNNICIDIWNACLIYDTLRIGHVFRVFSRFIPLWNIRITNYLMRL